MERCDFSSIITIIRTYISEDHEMSQIDFAYMLFDSFISNKENKDFDFDNGLVCRWFNGQARISTRISKFYLDDKNKYKLTKDIFENVLLAMFDSSMAIQKLYELVIQDNTISESKKNELTVHYPCSNLHEQSQFITEILCFSMSRDFVKRDRKTNSLISTGNLSPVVYNYISNVEPPKPCKYFCGRDNELKELHDMLLNNGKVFLHGIAGIGKSELAKAYANQYKKEYTNIIYFTYSGDLVTDIRELDFIDDLQKETKKERFSKHHRFLRSLKEDTLLIIDNFNTMSTQDKFLSDIMKYHCRILFTTRSKFDFYTCMPVNEISNIETLVDLVGKYYSEANCCPSIIEEIIYAVHSHTLAVELAARLLEVGILNPQTLLNKLLIENVALTSSDEIKIQKDGNITKKTYYGHIHTLFSLFNLNKNHQNILCNMSLIPITGINAQQFAHWLNLSDMNAINELIEMGFITELSRRMISLHPMIQEIIIADLKPSISKCKILCDNLQYTCLSQGLDIPYFKLLFQTIENFIFYSEKDDLNYYLLFLEIVFPYMNKYQYNKGMQLIIKELNDLIENKSVGKLEDKALLLDFRASIETNFPKAIKLDKEALALIPQATKNNAVLISNINNNISGHYLLNNNIELAKKHLEQCFELYNQFQLPFDNNNISQIVNYALLLIRTGELIKGMDALYKLENKFEDANLTLNSDYAYILEIIGSCCFLLKKLKESVYYLRKALAIYEIVYQDAPDLLEEKKNIINFTLSKISVLTAQHNKHI